MDLIRTHPVRRFRGETVEAVPDAVIAEVRLELDVNDGQYRLAMLCLPQDLEALAVGFLLGEGVLRRREDLVEVAADLEQRRVSVTGAFDGDALEALSQRWTWGTGCGGGGTGQSLFRPDVVPVAPGPVIAPQTLRALARQFEQRATLWRQTGGVHACALAGGDDIDLFAEDVGRHNAFDKVVGRAFLDGVSLADKLVLTTGRLSAEIASKAGTCGVPILASRSAVTSMAIHLARRLNVTLVGFLRGERLTVYSGFERISDGAEPLQEGA